MTLDQTKITIADETKITIADLLALLDSKEPENEFGGVSEMLPVILGKAAAFYYRANSEIPAIPNMEPSYFRVSACWRALNLAAILLRALDIEADFDEVTAG